MNNAPWQAVVNANNTNTFSLTENNFTTAKAAEAKQSKIFSASSKKTVSAPKRYSFDDNGGGYRGL